MEKEKVKKRKKGIRLKFILIVVGCLFLTLLILSIFFPVYSTMTPQGFMSKAVAHAKQVVTACWNYASDRKDMKFPGDLNSKNSNEALKLLISEYSPSEQIFSYPESIIAKNAGIENPDDVYETESEKLKAGECSWAYIAGMKLGGKEILPFLLTPWEGGGSPKYTNEKGKVGSQFDGKFAIVAFNDTSVHRILLDTKNPKAASIPALGKESGDGFVTTHWKQVLHPPYKVLQPLQK